MRNCATLLLLLICMGVKAQWVDIPDNRFGNWLNNKGYSNCLRPGTNTLWQLDTTCSQVISTTRINYTFSLPNYDDDITGIEYFRNLDTLQLGYSSIASLPALPQSLTYLSLMSNALTTLGVLPGGLLTLICSDSPMGSLGNLPSGLKHLDCQRDSLVSLPVLPNTLEYLDCGYNNITSLPQLPANLKTLNCPGNQLSELPTLPNGLEVLFCCYNHQISQLPAFPNSLKEIKINYLNLTTVPTLPDSLIYLDPDHNNITSLPELPATLRYLWISNNPITVLPTLPDGLIYLTADSCQLTSIPVVPSAIKNLIVSANNLHFIGDFPDSLNFFNCTNNAELTCLPRIKQVNYLFFDSTTITCLPMRPDVIGSTPDISQYPICDSVSYDACRNITAVNNITNNTAIEVYPNPFADYVNMNFQHAGTTPATISLTNMLGQVVFKQTANIQAATQTVTPGNIPSGLYLLQIVAGEQRVAKQIMKQ